MLHALSQVSLCASTCFLAPAYSNKLQLYGGQSKKKQDESPVTQRVLLCYALILLKVTPDLPTAARLEGSSASSEKHCFIATLTTDVSRAVITVQDGSQSHNNNSNMHDDPNRRISGHSGFSASGCKPSRT